METKNNRLNEIENILKEIALEQKEREKREEERRKEIDEQLKKTEKQLAETDKQIRNLGKQIGELTDGWGKFVEGIAEPSVLRAIRKMGYKVLTVSKYVDVLENGKKKTDFDLLIQTLKGKKRKYVFVVEVKSYINTEDIKEFEKHLMKFSNYFPLIKADGVLGVLAGARYQEGAETYGRRKGFFVFVPSDGMMKLLYKGKVKVNVTDSRYKAKT